MQPHAFSSRVGSATRAATSPDCRPVISYGTVTLLTASKAAISSSTETPTPVLKLKARTRHLPGMQHRDQGADDAVGERAEYAEKDVAGGVAGALAHDGGYEQTRLMPR
jgi:hypothetical protein